MRAARLVVLLSAAATALAFLPVLDSGWVAWDDPKNFLQNPHFRGFAWDNVVWMFTQAHVGNYQPLSWLTLALDYVLWGTDPKGYHLTNLLLHSANAALFCLVCLALLPLGQKQPGPPTEPAPPAGGRRLRGIAEGDASPFHGWPLAVSCLFASLFWALHPLRVEPAAWITARRDLLSTFFLLTSLLFWLAWARAGLRRWYAASLAAYALSLLSKAMGMSFPVLLLILELYPLSRRPRLKALAPFILLALGGAASGLWSVSKSGFLPMADFSPLQRLARACYAWVFYLAKTVWPSGLSPMYEVPQYLDPWSTPYVLSMAVVVLAALALLRWGRRVPAVTAALAAFTAAVLPVLGFVQAGSLLAADRFTYIPGLALALLAGGVLLSWRSRRGPMVLCAVFCLVLGLQSRRQIAFWKDSESLWGRVLALSPDNAMGHAQMAGVLAEKGDWEGAEAHMRQAILLRPRSASYRRYLSAFLFNHGNSLLRRERAGDAVPFYRQALGQDPGWAEARNNLGLALSRSGRLAEACVQYRRALQADPGLREARLNLADCLARRGRPVP